MFRRSRFSVRPNVGSSGRAAAGASQESPLSGSGVGGTPCEDTAAGTEPEKVDVIPSEKAAASGSGNEQTGEGAGSSSAVQRRKRFSVKPRVAPGRPATLPRTQRSPVKASSQSPAEDSVSGLDKSPPSTSSQASSTVSTEGLLSPRRRRPSEGCKQLRAQPKPALIPSECPTPANDSVVKSHLSADTSKQAEIPSGSQSKEAPLVRGPDKIPLSLPDREAAEISAKARTLASSKAMPSLTPSAYSLSRLLNTPSDVQRLVKAQKLRELLKQERRKEKTLKRAKARAKDFSLDPSKMTMRDLIHYLPTTNPMTSYEDSSQENETVLPLLPETQNSTQRVQVPEVPPKVLSEDDPEEADEEDDDALMVPQVKVAEDGSLIIDEESLTVEVQRAKGPNPAVNRDPIFERGSTTTYSSFRKGSYTRPWSSEETDMFFLAVSMVGTDFTMICQLFPHRARSEIKNKFKKEERENSWRVDKAFQERRKLDIEYFTKLLEKIMDYQKSKKKLKSVVKANAPKKSRKKAKASGRKSAKKLSDVEEEDTEDEEIVVLDMEEEGEKENEDVFNEGGASGNEVKHKTGTKVKNRTRDEAEEPTGKKSKTAEQSSDQSKVDLSKLPDTDDALPDDHTCSDISGRPTEDSVSKDTSIKPAKLSRKRAPKPLLPLGRKWAKKLPELPFTECEDEASAEMDENGADEASNKQAPPPDQAKVSKEANDVSSSEEEEMVVQPPRPTRYGRVPKPTKLLAYSPEEGTHSSVSETPLGAQIGSPSSEAKAKCPTKRKRSTKPQPSKKPKLITLRASQSDFSDEESENRPQDEKLELAQQLACSSNVACSDSAFVPDSLNTPQPVISEVDETMAELDILASMPDVLGISHEALCPDSSCAHAQQETGSAEPFEHQLDLLVDVIDYLSSDHAEEVSEDQSYNEAAETLLTIGNVGLTSQSEEGQTSVQDFSPVKSLAVDEEEGATSSPGQEEESPLISSAVNSSEQTEMAATASPRRVETTTTDAADVVTLETRSQTCEDQVIAETAPPPKLQSCQDSQSQSSPQTKKGRMAKLKPKPNLGRSFRAAQVKLNSEESAVETAKGSPTTAPVLLEIKESLPAHNGTDPKMLKSISESLKDDSSYSQTPVKQTNPGSEESFHSSQSSSRSTAELQKQSLSEKSDNVSSFVEGTQAGDNAEISESPKTKVDQVSLKDTNVILESSSKDVISVSTAESSQNRVKEWEKTRQFEQCEQQDVKTMPSLPQSPGRGLYESQTPETAADDESCPTGVSRDSKLTFKSNESPTSSVQPFESGCADVTQKDSTITEAPVGEGTSTHPKTVDVLPPKQEEEKELFTSELESSNEPEDRDMFLSNLNKDTPAVSHFAEKQSDSLPEGDFTDGAPLRVADPPGGQGSNEVSAPIQVETEPSPVPCTSGAEFPVLQKEVKAASTPQLRKSRLQKPTPKFPQTPRPLRSKPGTTKSCAEEDVSTGKSVGDSRSNLDLINDTPVCVQTEKSSIDLVGMDLPGTGSGSTERQDGSTARVPCVEHLGLHQRAANEGEVEVPIELRKPSSQDPKSSEALKAETSRTEPETKRQKDKVPEVTVGDTTSHSLGQLTPCLCTESGFIDVDHSKDSESPAGPSSDKDSSQLQVRTGKGSVNSPVEDLSVSQKQIETPSTSRKRKSRLQKPKPNLPRMTRTSQSKLESASESEEKDLTSKESLGDKETTFQFAKDNPASPTETECSSVILEKPNSAGTGPPVEEALSVILDSSQIQVAQSHSESAVSCVEDLQTKQMEGAVESTSRRRMSRLQKPKPNLAHSSSTLRSRSGIPEMSGGGDLSLREDVVSPTPTSMAIHVNLRSSETNSGCVHAAKTDPELVPEPQTSKQKSNVELAEVPLDGQTMFCTKGEASPTQSEHAFTCQRRRGRFQKLKPNLPQTSRTTRTRPEKESDLNTNPDLETTQPKILEPTSLASRTSLHLHSTPVDYEEVAEKSKTCTEQVASAATPTGDRIRDLENIQPNDARVESVKIKNPVDIASKISDENQLSHSSATEIRAEHVTTDLALTQVRHDLCADAIPDMGDDCQPEPPATSVAVRPVSQAREAVVQPSQLRKSRLQKVKPKPNLSQARPTQLKDTHVKTRGETSSSLSRPSVQPEAMTTQDEGPSSIEETTAASWTRKQTKESSSTDEENKAHQQVSKPKGLQQRMHQDQADPNAVPSTRSEETQLQSGDSSNISENSCLKVSSEIVSSQECLPTDIDPKSMHNKGCTLELSHFGSQEPIESIIREPSNQHSMVKDDEGAHQDGAAPANQHSHASMTTPSPVQVASTSSPGWIQTSQALSDFLPEHVPSDPDEPFFILSLTAIPDPTSTETPQSETGPLIDRPTDTSIQEQSVPEESSVTRGDQSALSEPSSAEASDFRSSKYPTAPLVTAENSQETSPSAVQPPEPPQTEASSVEGKRAGSQTEPSTAPRKQRGKAPPPRQKKPGKDLEDSGPSAPKTTSDGEVDQDQEGQMIREDSNQSTTTTKRVRGQRQKGKPKDETASLKTPPPTKARAKGSKTEPPPPNPAASSSHAIHSAQQIEVTSQTEAGPGADPSSPVCTAEVSASQESVCVSDSGPDEEPIGVSQYFFGDIFTEVEK